MKLVPLHSVTVTREHPKKEKDKDGNVKHVRVAVPVGKVFDFTDEEVEDLKASGHEFRTPQKRGGDDEPEELLDADEVERQLREAANHSSNTNGTAGLDTLNTLKAARKGKAKPPTKETGNGDNEKVIETESVEDETAEDEDAL